MPRRAGAPPSAGRSLNDSFGFKERCSAVAVAQWWSVAENIVNAVRTLEQDLAVVDVYRDDAGNLYKADVALIRPGQVDA